MGRLPEYMLRENQGISMWDPALPRVWVGRFTLQGQLAIFLTTFGACVQSDVKGTSLQAVAAVRA